MVINGTEIPVTVKRSSKRRKTISIKLENGGVTVTAPLREKQEYILQVVYSKRDWIYKRYLEHLREMNEPEQRQFLSADEINELAQKAVGVFRDRTTFYENIMGVKASHVSVKLMRSRWGSCSSKGDISFNCLLMLAPQETLDSIVVHELSHLLEMNHSKAFYKIVYSAFPDYGEQHKWLRLHGKEIMGRVPENISSGRKLKIW